MDSGSGSVSKNTKNTKKNEEFGEYNFFNVYYQSVRFSEFVTKDKEIQEAIQIGIVISVSVVSSYIMFKITKKKESEVEAQDEK